MSDDRRTPLTDAWRKRLTAALLPRGRQADLARFLSRNAPDQFPGRKVQIAQVLHHGLNPQAEFVLATLAWLDGQKVRQKKSGAKKDGGPGADA